MADSQPKRRPKTNKSQLKVVLDTNALYVAPNNLGSASDLVRQEISNLISQSKYPDLDIHWYLPEMVRHERQYQMQTEALKLRSAIDKIERLLDHNLALTDAVLLNHVKTRIDEKAGGLGLQELRLDYACVDWARIADAAAYRKPPFQTGEKEKGFRDALIAESFLQLVENSPRTPNLCRVVLVTADSLLRQAVSERISNSSNASVLAGSEELKGLINTIVSNVGEEFINQIKPKARKLFFVSSENKETIFYKETIRERLEETFKSELEFKPPSTVFRRNKTWQIEQPNFSRKEGRRIFWTSRIEIELEAGTVTRQDEPKNMVSLSSLLGSDTAPLATPLSPPFGLPTSWFQPVTSPQNALSSYALLAPETRVVTHKGQDIFEVLWSTEVTMSRELKKPNIEDIRHVEIKYQPIS